SKEEFTDSKIISKYIKQFPLEIVATAPIQDAISTVGGISRNALSPHFEIEILPNNYCIGEMIDWDAPTGGYLLQACFSMGTFLVKNIS
ncbi:MAG: NAD(P)/FAD-dependent oxidoreductase, partial [Crocinitomicaceae bacterium]